MGVMSVSLEVLITLSGWRFGDLIPDNLFSLGPLNIQLSSDIKKINYKKAIQRNC
jgi:hypothetical protein